MPDETTNQQVAGSYNDAYVGNTSFMMMRLDTTPLIRDIKKAIGARESKVTFDPTHKVYVEKMETVGKPLANDEGVMQICNIVEMFINQHIAQGNFKDTSHYWEAVASFREDFAEEVVKKCYDWGVDDPDLDGLCNKVSLVVELFLTRAIDNKERESYAQNFQTREVLTQMENKRGLMGFAGGIAPKR